PPTEVALGSNVAQQATGPFPNPSSGASALAPLQTKPLMALPIATHQPADPSARAISSVASNSSAPVPPSPPSASGTRTENRLAFSKAAATLSVSRPSRSDASASSAIRLLIAFVRSSGLRGTGVPPLNKADLCGVRSFIKPPFRSSVNGGPIAVRFGGIFRRVWESVCEVLHTGRYISNCENQFRLDCLDQQPSV